MLLQVKKLEERGDKMPNTLVKLEREKQNLAAAAEEISTSHKKIMEELPIFYNKRIDYIQPSLQVIILTIFFSMLPWPAKKSD